MKKGFLQLGVTTGGASVGAGARAGNRAGSVFGVSWVLDTNMSQIGLRVGGSKVTQTADVRLLICREER